MRYERRAVLGRGATGVVYRAYDTELQQEIALKTLHAVTADRDQQLKFEFRVLRGITHPNLVQLYDLVVDDDEAFFTMELVEGGDMISAIRAHSPPLAPLDTDDLARLRAVFGQLTVCLASLHENGRVHRDLKPANIMVTPSGQVRLLDFGFAAVVRANAGDDDLTIAGTLPYMAPEQIWGMPPAPGMDWYSVGVLLWEALAGIACFDGSPANMLRIKEHGPIPDVRDRVPAAAAELATLAHMLLDPDPGNRPGAATIAAVFAGEQPSLAVAASPRAAPVYVGRVGELATLADWLATVARGGPCIAHVVGTSGLGKTALGRHFAGQAEDALVLWSRCHPQEAVPFKALDGAIEGLARYLQRDAAAAAVLGAIDTAALAAVFPALAPVDTASPAGPLDARERRRRGFAALRALITALAHQRPLVLWIDDAQWGDRDSAQALIEVLRGPAAPRVLLILAYRGEESETAALVTELARADIAAVARIDLAPLPSLQARALAAAWLARADDDPLVERVVAESAGSPFLVEQLSAYLRDPSAAAEPIGLAGAVLGQVDRLGDTARAVAELISVAGGALDLAQLLRLADDPEAMRLVYRLREQRILRTVATRPKSVEIYHDRIREALLAALPGTRRAMLHRQVADVLRDHVGNPELQLEHLLGAGDRAGAAEAAVAAAERNVAALAFGRAAELFAQGVELRARGDADWALQGRHGEALANAGLGSAAGRAFAAAAAAAERGGATAAEILTLRAAAARELLCAGEFRPGTEALSAMLVAAGLSYPRRPIGAVARLLWARTRIATRGLEFAARPEAAAAAPASVLARIDACWAATVGLNSFDAVRSAAFQAQHTLLALDAGETVRVVRALTAEAVYRAAEGGARGRDRAATLIERVDQLAAPLDDSRARGFARLCAGVASYFAGDWSRAVARLADAERIFRELHGVGWEINNCWAYRLWAFTWMGELGRLLSEQREASAEVQGREDALAVIGSASGHANLVWLVADRPDEARVRAAAAIAPFPRDTFQSPHYADFVAQMRIDLYRGDAWAAWRRQHDTLPRLRRIQLLRLQLFRIEVWSLVASAALAASAAGPAPRDLAPWDRPRLLRAAASATARLRREDLPAARVLADALDAARAAHDGDESGFAGVGAALERHGLGMYAAAARYRAAAAGGTSSHERWPNVHAPDRMAAMLLPAPGDR